MLVNNLNPKLELVIKIETLMMFEFYSFILGICYFMGMALYPYSCWCQQNCDNKHSIAFPQSQIFSNEDDDAQVGFTKDEL